MFSSFKLCSALAIAAFVVAKPAAAQLPGGTARSSSAPVAASVPRLAGVRDVGRATPSSPVRIVLTLTYRHDAELQQLIALQSDPRSPYYHRFLSARQFSDYFAPSAMTEERAVGALRRAGFYVTQRSENRTIVDAVAPAATAERYFSTEIHRFAEPSQGVRYANVHPAIMPAELRGSVAAVSGLSNIIYIRPSLAFATPAQRAQAKGRAAALELNARPQSKSPSYTPIGGPLTGPDGGYGPAIVANDYDLPVQHGYNGAGRATGVAISGDYADSDLNGYLAEFGVKRLGSTTRVAVDGGAHYDPNTPDTQEATLDTETIVGLTPATHLYMYLMPDLGDVSIIDDYNRAVSDNLVDVIDSSFGGCEVGDAGFNLAVNRIAAQGAAKGITFSASSGDQGSRACTDSFGLASLGVNTPASVPNVVAVGGTSLYVHSNGSYQSESGWSGSTGGYSVVWAQPSYQQKFPGVTGKTRNVPDIAFPADPATGSAYYLAGLWQGPIGGTSWSSPIFCALQTQIDQRRNTRFGYVNPLLYAAFRTVGSKAYNDVTNGSNGDYNALRGYDLVTGIGTLHGMTFASLE